MDAYEYVTYFLHGDYMSSLRKKVPAYRLRWVLRKYCKEETTVDYWNHLISYFILPSDAPGDFKSMEELVEWTGHGHG